MNKNKKIVTLLAVSVLVSFFTLTVAAASCLDVVNYGEHRYQQRYYEPYEANYVLLGLDGHGHYVIQYDICQRRQCVCGAEKVFVLSSGNIKYVSY